jgi:hypothetical protein
LGQDSIFRINTFRRFILPHCFFNFLLYQTEPVC